MEVQLYKLIEDLQAATILIVSQNESDVTKIKTLLNKNGFSDVKTTDDPYSVPDYFENEELDFIILDIKLKGMDGFGVMDSLKEASIESGKQGDIPPILVLTDIDLQEHKRRALSEGANDFINFPFDTREFLARVKNLLKIWQAQKIIHHQKEILEYKVSQRTKQLHITQEELHNSRLEVVWRLGRAAEYRDNETGLHIIRMSKMAALLAKALGMSDEEVDLILNASPMHDIGKLGIPDSILLKPGKLNEKEWEIMKTHAQIGADILGGSKSPLLEMAHEIALTHHEKWDGSGYPNQLKGEEIPIASRLSTMGDVFDALTSDRPYKEAWSVTQTMEYFYKQSGKQFDPSLVKLLIKELPGILKIKEEFSEPEKQAT